MEPSKSFLTHALELPELVDHVVVYLSQADILACSRVSKEWFRSFTPVLWRHPSINRRRWADQFSKIPAHVLEERAHLIESLRLARSPHRDIILRKVRRLRQLALHFNDPHREFPIVDKVRLIQQNPQLERLYLAQGWWHWAHITPATHAHLRHLVLHQCRLERQNTIPFWAVVRQLESIELHTTSIPMEPRFFIQQEQHRWPTLDGTFPYLKAITVSRMPFLRAWHMRSVQFLDWLERCPNLTSLKCRTAYTYRLLPDRLISLFNPSKNNPLEVIGLGSTSKIDPEALLVLLQQTTAPNSSSPPTLDTFHCAARPLPSHPRRRRQGLREFWAFHYLHTSKPVLDLLYTDHRLTLTRICLRQAKEMSADENAAAGGIYSNVPVASEYHVRLLRECPMLEEFYGHAIGVNDLLGNGEPWKTLSKRRQKKYRLQPWACEQRLKILVVAILVTGTNAPLTIFHLQRKLPVTKFSSKPADKPDRFREKQVELVPLNKARQGRQRYLRKHCSDASKRDCLAEHVQIYERLSRFRELEELDLSVPYGRGTRGSLVGSNFLLGFGKLGRLKKLRRFGCGNNHNYHCCPDTYSWLWIMGIFPAHRPVEKQQHHEEQQGCQSAQTNIRKNKKKRQSRRKRQRSNNDHGEGSSIPTTMLSKNPVNSNDYLDNAAAATSETSQVLPRHRMRPWSRLGHVRAAKMSFVPVLDYGTNPSFNYVTLREWVNRIPLEKRSHLTMVFQDWHDVEDAAWLDAFNQGIDETTPVELTTDEEDEEDD